MINDMRHYFLCGIGGSGMLPLAVILRARGHRVSGSDRALDQGRTEAKFDYLAGLGIDLFAQDGSGLVSPEQVLVASAAVEDSVPDIAAAKRLGAKRMTRAEALAALFNAAPLPIGVAGTSGKSTTTAMLAWILYAAGADPTVMNGAVMKNFVNSAAPFASALVGNADAFISELDESDGSISLFNPKIAVLTNVSLDHRPMAELRQLFGAFIRRSACAVVNLDNAEAAALRVFATGRILTFSTADRDADFVARRIALRPFGADFELVVRGRAPAVVTLAVPGRHNVANALAAIAAASAAGVAPEKSAKLLGQYQGVSRRFDRVGEAGGVTVIDDFGHNPDKINATLQTLHAFPGRVLVLFQPHGFGPLKKMRDEFIEAFASGLGPDDVLVMPDPVYYGGTADRSVTSLDITTGVAATGRTALAFPDREAAADHLVSIAAAGDRIVIMGARDDTLPAFAQALLARLQAAKRPG